MSFQFKGLPWGVIIRTFVWSHHSLWSILIWIKEMVVSPELEEIKYLMFSFCSGVEAMCGVGFRYSKRNASRVRRKVGSEVPSTLHAGYSVKLKKVFPLTDQHFCGKIWIFDHCMQLYKSRHDTAKSIIINKILFPTATFRLPYF